MQHSLDDLILEGINDITNLADGNGDYDESQGAQAINNAASNIVSQGWLGFYVMLHVCATMRGTKFTMYT